MRTDFDVFAAELLDQIEAVQLLEKALAPVLAGGEATGAKSADVPVLEVDEADRDAWRALADRVAAPNPSLGKLTG